MLYSSTTVITTKLCQSSTSPSKEMGHYTLVIRSKSRGLVCMSEKITQLSSRPAAQHQIFFLTE